MSELDKLEKYLKEKGYQYERIDESLMIEYPDGTEHDNGRHQIIVYEEGERSWDVVCQYGSYGYEKGKLEGMGEKIVRGSDSVEGWLTADDVIKRLEGKNE